MLALRQAPCLATDLKIVTTFKSMPVTSRRVLWRPIVNTKYEWQILTESLVAFSSVQCSVRCQMTLPLHLKACLLS